MPNHLPSILAVALAAQTLAPCTPQNSRVQQLLSEKQRTAHFDIRYRKNSRAGASVDRAAVEAEKNLVDICRQLQFDIGKARFVIHLFDDTAELAEITKTAGNAGFSVGHQMFIPHGNDQTRYHEMVHLVAFRLRRAGREPRNLFFAEGLANALLTFVHGVHVHAVAAVELRYGKMPKLTDMIGARDFYAWLRTHPGFDAYDVAASYIRFLIDTEGIAKVKRYYTGLAAKKAFGKSKQQLERAWHGFLRRFPMRPAVITLLRKRRGDAARFTPFEIDVDKRLPADVLGKPGEWRELKPDAKAIGKTRPWHEDGDKLVGETKTNDWNILPLAHAALRDGVLRAKVRFRQGTVGVQLQLGNDCQAMITNAGVFLWKDGIRHQDRSERLAGTGPLDLVLVRQDGVVTLYIDGIEVVSGKVGDAPGIPGIGVAGGNATFSQVRIRTSL